MSHREPTQSSPPVLCIPPNPHTLFKKKRVGMLTKSKVTMLFACHDLSSVWILFHYAFCSNLSMNIHREASSIEIKGTYF